MSRGMLAKPAVLAALVFVMAFSLYGVTTSPFLFGYEGENAAVAEGLVRTGDRLTTPALRAL